MENTSMAIHRYCMDGLRKREIFRPFNNPHKSSHSLDLKEEEDLHFYSCCCCVDFLIQSNAPPFGS